MLLKQLLWDAVAAVTQNVLRHARALVPVSVMTIALVVVLNAPKDAHRPALVAVRDLVGFVESKSSVVPLCLQKHNTF